MWTDALTFGLVFFQAISLVLTSPELLFLLLP